MPSEKSERLRMLDELVGKLSPKKKLVLVLFEIEGLPIEEVAKIAECPENTAWSRLHYARAELMAMARKRAESEGAGRSESAVMSPRLARRRRSDRGRVAACARRGAARGPDDVMFRRGWAAFGGRPTPAPPARLVLVRRRHGEHRRPARGVRGVAVAARRRDAGRADRATDDGRRVVRRPSAGGRRAAHAGRRCRGPAGALERDAHRAQRRARRRRRRPVQVPHRRPGHPFVVRADAIGSSSWGRSSASRWQRQPGRRRRRRRRGRGLEHDVRLAHLEPGQRWNSAPRRQGVRAGRRPAGRGARET